MIIMSGKGRFHIPSIQEMDQSSNTQQPSVKRLFDSHRPGINKLKESEESRPASKSSPIISGSGSNHRSISNSSTTPSSNPSKLISSTPQSLPTDSSIQNKNQITAANQNTNTSSPTKGSTENSSAAALLKTSSSVIVSNRQKGNPILKSVRNVPWEFGDIIPDYVMGQTTCALFLSLRYHALNPNYIHERLKQLGHSYNLRVLLVQVDTKDPHFALKQLAKVCILSDCTLIVAWSSEEAGRYLETYKSFETKPPEMIMEKTDSDFMSRLSDVVTTVKKVNKTDAVTLLSAFGSFQKSVEATEEDLSLCPGFGPQKAKRLHSVFHEPFKKVKISKTGPESTSPVKATTNPPGKKKS